MTSPNSISYKDSAARVVKDKKGYIRYIFFEYQKEYDFLINSGLYKELLTKELIIGHTEIEETAEDPNVYKTIYPFQIPFQSYPFEWSFLQWKRMLLSYIEINFIALKYGMLLKDASPYNFCQIDDKSKMHDTTSFSFIETQGSWNAYQQFCENILGPFMLIYHNGIFWSKLSMNNKSMQLNFISNQLPLRSWFNLNTLIHIHIHAKFMKKSKITIKRKNDIRFTSEKINLVLSQIKKQISNLNLNKNNSFYWADYYEKGIEDKKYLIDKENTLKDWLNSINIEKVVDLGSNIGHYSKIASEFAQIVISLDSDPNCIDSLEKDKSSKKIYPLVVDITSPTPNHGIFNEEFKSIHKRCESDLVLCLAITHHLYFSKNLPWSLIMREIAQYTRRFAIVEYINFDDSKINLIVNKAERIHDYKNHFFINATNNFFEIIKSKRMEGSSRTLYLLKRKTS